MQFHTGHTGKQNYGRNTSHNFVDSLSTFYGEIKLDFIPHLPCRLSETSAHVVVLELEPERQMNQQLFVESFSRHDMARQEVLNGLIVIVPRPGETVLVPAGWWQCSVALE